MHAVVVGSNAVDEVQGASAIVSVERLDLAGSLELFDLRPVGFFLFHLPVWIAAIVEGLQRLLQRLGHIAVIDHPTPEVDDFVDVLEQQRAFFFACAASCARPDFVFRINIAD